MHRASDIQRFAEDPSGLLARVWQWRRMLADTRRYYQQECTSLN